MRGRERTLIEQAFRLRQDCPNGQSRLRPTLPGLDRAADAHPVGAENRVTLCDLGILMNEAAEPVSPQHPDIRAWSR